jgi:hypothetical protein
MPIPSHHRLASWPASLEERPTPALKWMAMARVLALVACLLLVWGAIVVL